MFLISEASSYLGVMVLNIELSSSRSHLYYLKAGSDCLLVPVFFSISIGSVNKPIVRDCD